MTTESTDNTAGLRSGNILAPQPFPMENKNKETTGQSTKERATAQINKDQSRIPQTHTLAKLRKIDIEREKKGHPNYETDTDPIIAETEKKENNTSSNYPTTQQKYFRLIKR